VKDTPTLDKQPIRKLQAQYEYFILKVYGRATCRQYSHDLAEFFRVHPNKYTPEDFFKTDVLDYQIIREKEGASPNTINKEVDVVRAFWNWMIESKDLPLVNIATVRRLRFVPKEKSRLTLAEFSRLMSEVHDPKLAAAIRNVLKGEMITGQLGGCPNVTSKFRQALNRSGVPKIRLRDLPKAVHQAALLTSSARGPRRYAQLCKSFISDA
jgi:integrase